MKLVPQRLVVGFCALALLGQAVCCAAQQPGKAHTGRRSSAPQDRPTGKSDMRVERLPPVERVARRDTSERTADTKRTRTALELLLLRANEADSQQPVGVEPLPAVENQPTPETVLPRDGVPWWQVQSLKPLGQSPTTISVDVDSLVVQTLRYSARVQAISDTAIIAETNITRADAQFDASAFMESKFIRNSIPTGSTLEAGFNVPRLREEDWFYRAGLRRQNAAGGRFEIAQRVGIHDSNSNFFFPANQGNARMTLSYNQPLLNGAGVAYNTSLIVLAKFDTRIAIDRSAAELQDHLVEVTETLWQLYLQRCVLLQRQKHFERAQSIMTRLERRRDVDSLESQIARARAAVALRRTAVIRADTAIRNAESHLRSLVNSPDLLANRTMELVPRHAPSSDLVSVDMQRALITGLENRPEINAATQEVEAARVRLGVAQKELLPVLDAVLETYVSGLNGDYNIGRSLGDQFTLGGPSYTGGLVFDMPLGRRAAKANQTRRQAELRQLCSRFKATVETVTSEVEVAVREVETAYRELQAKDQAMQACDADMQYLQRRWEMVPGEDRAASFMLEDLLDAQDRLALSEFNVAQGQVEYTLSLTRLNRALGTLLKHEQVAIIRSSEQGAPKILFEKRDTARETLLPPTHP